MTIRTVDGFFYGLFMDPAVLAKFGIQASNPRRAYAENVELLIGRRATLWPADGARAYGMVYTMAHSDLDKLYGGDGLTDYKPEGILTVAFESSGGKEQRHAAEQGQGTACLCYNLIEKPSESERNKDYAAELAQALDRLAFPQQYVKSVANG